MQNIISIGNLFHRSRERIRDLGEVFTPDKYVEDMLDLLGQECKNFWANENRVFFEPCCGHGNIVLAIYRRRLQAIYQKAMTRRMSKPYLYTIANALNTLWAIDIDTENIETCRMRVLALTLEFLAEKINCKNISTLVSQHKNFFAHVLAALSWHIRENETLSALSSSIKAESKARKTKAGYAWFESNGHHQLNFDTTWVAFFTACKRKKIVPREFKQSQKFIASLSQSNRRVHKHRYFDFASKILKPLAGEIAA